MIMMTEHLVRTAGKAVVDSQTLAEALGRNTCETKKKSACFDRLVTTLWHFKCAEEHLVLTEAYSK
jgi:hypothetical protein